MGWLYQGGAADCIDFTVDKDIMLHGLHFFGSENNDYSVTSKGGARGHCSSPPPLFVTINPASLVSLVISRVLNK